MNTTTDNKTAVAMGGVGAAVAAGPVAAAPALAGVATGGTGAPRAEGTSAGRAEVTGAIKAEGAAGGATSAGVERAGGAGEVKTRWGKIARLPREVREEVNRRLDDGEMSGPILAWLNAQAVVQEVLRRHFEGKAVSEQNLSAWRLGGYEEWVRAQVKLERDMVRREHLEEIAAMGGPEQAAVLAGAAMTALGDALTDAMLRPAGLEKEKSILAIIRALGRLQANERAAARAQRERETYQRAVADDLAKRRQEAIAALDAEKKEMDGYYADARELKATSEKAGKPVALKVREFLAGEAAYRADWKKRREIAERGGGGGVGGAGVVGAGVD